MTGTISNKQRAFRNMTYWCLCAPQSDEQAERARFSLAQFPLINRHSSLYASAYPDDTNRSSLHFVVDEDSSCEWEPTAPTYPEVEKYYQEN
jgi:hypothetical protein